MNHLQRWTCSAFCTGFVISLMMLASHPSYAKDRWYGSESVWAGSEGYCYNNDEWSNNTPYITEKGTPSDTSTPRPVPNLDCWLTQAWPTIGAQIIWQEGYTSGTTMVSYPNWTQAQKTDLLNAFATAWNWYEQNFTCNATNQSGCDLFPVGNWNGSVPPQNQVANDPNNVFGYTVLSATDAWHYYVDSVAQTLAAQLGHWYYWDLRWQYFINVSDLKYLLDSREMFFWNGWTADSQGFGYATVPFYDGIGGIVDAIGSPIHGEVTLTAPRYQLDFLRTKGMIHDSDVAATIYAAFDWGRDNLAHYNSAGLSETQAEKSIWNYDGEPPVSFMLNGTQSTTATDIAIGLGGTIHWTAGCHGTSGFYKSILRSANIPVQVLNVSQCPAGCAHSQVNIAINQSAVGSPQKTFLSHSDDIYSQAFRDQTVGSWAATNPPTTPVQSTQNLFLSYTNSYSYYFDPSLGYAQLIGDVDASSASYLLGLSANGFAPTNVMMNSYCNDLAQGLSHAAGQVYNNNFVSLGTTMRGITVSAVENAGLWTALEAKRVATPGGCTNPSFQPVSQQHSLPTNQAPVVNAGSNQTITLPAAASLAGTVTDDGQPNPPGKVTTKWAKVSGPGTVTFANASSLKTTATFSVAGSYTLSLTASDSALATTGNIVVAVNAAGTTPCSGLCSNPTSFTINGSFQSGNLGSGAVCYQTTSTMKGGNCGNFVAPRTLKVNGTTEPCTGANWSSLPAKKNGGYCIQTTSGNQSWAYFTAF